MNGWEISAELLVRMSCREEKYNLVREIERQWSALEDTSSKKAYSLMVQWIRAQVEAIGAKGVVLGVSGGADSTLAALIAKDALPLQSLAMILPMGEDGERPDDALQLLSLLEMKYEKIDIKSLVDNISLAAGLGDALKVRGNLITRVRSAIVYGRANEQELLVMGTGDIDETYLGYSTKGTTADLFPITGLHKDEIRAHVKRELSRYDEDFAEYIAGKPSTPGYVRNHRAEDDLGIGYDRIGPVLEIVLKYCDVWNTGILPRDPEGFHEAVISLEHSGKIPGGISNEDFLRVEELMMKNYHKAIGSPALLRPGE